MLIVFDTFWLCRTVRTDPLADESSQKAEAALCATDCAPDSIAQKTVLGHHQHAPWHPWRYAVHFGSLRVQECQGAC